MIYFALTKFILPRIGQSPTQGEEITVTYWGLWEPPGIMKELITAFEAENPGIRVQYQQQTIKDYRERLQNALTNGAGPDIFRFHLTWSPLFAAQLSPIPAQIMSSADFEAQQYPVARTWLQSNNGYLGIPFMYDGLGLFYNREIFEAAGKTPPQTWEELRRTALELTVKNKENIIQRSGVSLGATSNVDNWSDILGLLLLQNGANPANPTSQEAQDAVTFYTIFSRSDRVWDDTLPSSTVAFSTGKVAMMIAPSWRALEVRQNNPDLQFAIAPVPQLPNSTVNWASLWVDGVSNASDQVRQEAAWKFLGYLNQKETLRNWYALASKERLFGQIFARIDMADQISQDPFVGAYVSQAPTAKTWYLNSRTFDNGPNDRIIKYFEDAVNAVNEGESAATALSTTQQGVGQIVNQFRLPGMN